MEEIRKHKPKRVKPSPEAIELAKTADTDEGPEDTEFKLAVLASLHPDKPQDVHLDYLMAYGGSAYKASQAMSSGYDGVVKRRKTAANGYQSSIHAFATQSAESSESASPVDAAAESPIESDVFKDDLDEASEGSSTPVRFILDKTASDAERHFYLLKPSTSGAARVLIPLNTTAILTERVKPKTTKLELQMNVQLQITMTQSRAKMQ